MNKKYYKIQYIIDLKTGIATIDSVKRNSYKLNLFNSY